MIFKPIKNIIKHKYYVFIYCNKAGIPLQGLLHDMSKFSYIELKEHIKYSYGNCSPLKNSKNVNGYSLAKLHHCHNNKHHYEYWQDDFDLGCKPIKMPFKYALEMICDYLGASRCYMGNKFTYEAEYKWFINKKYNNKYIKMHQHTKEFIKRVLSIMVHENSCDVLSRKEEIKNIYKEIDLNDVKKYS